MTRFEYLEKLHDLIYQANFADSDSENRQDWQKPEHARDHCNPLFRIVDSLLTEQERQLFGDCLGDFDGFVALMERGDG